MTMRYQAGSDFYYRWHKKLNRNNVILFRFKWISYWQKIDRGQLWSKFVTIRNSSQVRTMVFTFRTQYSLVLTTEFNRTFRIANFLKCLWKNIRLWQNVSGITLVNKAVHFWVTIDHFSDEIFCQLRGI
jgi:hypothetical protein